MPYDQSLYLPYKYKSPTFSTLLWLLFPVPFLGNPDPPEIFAALPDRERVLYWQPTGPNALDHRDE